ncbi:MAG: hypothetical protein IKF36_01025 [Bacilli bacterium]|nr:hypothetical protein [Bacilli bacterium]
MKEMNKEVIDQIDKEAHNSLSMTKINDDLYLSQKQIDVLDRYEIEYKTKSIDSLMFEIDEILNDSYDDLFDLEDIAKEISEFNYYHNTKK